ncbi:MAG: hypothetical protein U1F43_20345 [Myxococcota bacterium]
MSAPDPKGGRRFLPARVLDGLKHMVEARLPEGDRARSAALALLARTDRLVERMERVADVELALLERMKPIVEDLGELVRLQLDDARRRLGGRSDDRPPTPPPKVIDVE